MALPAPRVDARASDTFQTLAWLDDDPRPLDWNGPADRLFVPFRDQDLHRPIIEHFERVARRHPTRIAVRHAETSLTFGQLWDGVSELAATLAAEARPGELIGILMPACSMFPVAMLACLAAGRPFVVLDTRYPSDWLDQVLNEARPTLILTFDEDAATRMPTARVISLTSLGRLSSQPGSPKRVSAKTGKPTPVGVDEPACVLFTSGSTGRPKGIVNSQRNLLQRVAQSINAAHINIADRLLTLSSPCTIVGVRDVLTALLSGARVHLLDPQGVGAREIANAIRAESTTILFGFPALLRSILAAREGRAPVSLRLVRVGGDTTLWSDIEALRSWLAPQAAIQVVYAATEAPMMQWFVDEGCQHQDARVPIGYPLPGNRLALIDEEGRATPPGEVGELIAASPYVSLGQWADGRVAHDNVETVAGGGRIFRTGDLARQRSDGLLERVGRKDRQVKIRGSRVDLDGIEAILRGHSSVRDVAVVPRTDAADSATTLVAYVHACEDAPAALIDELKTLAQSAPAAMRPARFYDVASIPRLPNSKLDTRALSALDETYARSERAESANQDALSAIARDHVSRSVAGVWQEVLGVPVRAGDDDFFDCGGDSLQAITFALGLERALGAEISLTLINETSRFDHLCDALRERRAPGSSPLVTLKSGNATPPLFFIHGIGGNVVKLLPTGRRVASEAPVIGVRARGVVRGEVPHTTIEAMAADYLEAIKERQPNGPYYLCGYSSGGLVAFEIARRLSESGDDVRLVGLFDTTMSPVRWPLRVWPSIIARRFGRLTASAATPIGAWPARLRKRIEQLRAVAPSLRVAAHTLIASAKYRPGFYGGQLTLFSPIGRDPGFPPLDSTWRAHAQAITVVETPGTHATMLSALHAEATAACLTRCLPSAELY